MKKKILSVFLIVAMAIGAMCVMVNAEGLTVSDPCATVTVDGEPQNGGQSMSFADALAIANTGTRVGHVVITLTKDAVIDFSSWVSGNARNAASLTLDGNGATVVGLTKPLFDSTCPKVTVKNLKFIESNITSINSNGMTGAATLFAGTAAGQIITIQNCKVIGGTITSDDPYGYAGAFIGYNQCGWEAGKPAMVVDGCEVKGVTISSTVGGSIGAIFGHLNNGCAEIKNTVIGNNTLNSEEDGAYREDKTGTVIGTLHTSTAYLDITEESASHVNGNTLTKPIGRMYHTTDDKVTPNVITRAELIFTGGEYLTDPTTINKNNNQSADSLTEIWLSKEQSASDITVGGVFAVEDGKYVIHTFKIGENTYGSLIEAVKNAEVNSVIEAVGDNLDIYGDGVVLDKSLTIDLKGGTYTLVGNPVNTDKGIRIASDAEVTIKDGTIASIYGSKVYSLVENGGTLTMSNFTLNGAELDNDKPYYLLTLTGGTVSLGDTVLTERTEGTLNTAAAVCAASAASTLNLGTANVSKIDVAADAELSLTGTGTVTELTVANGFKSVTKETTVTVTTIPADYFFKNESTLLPILAEYAEASITSGGVTTYYKYLADAYTAAAKGDTITLEKDVTLSATQIISTAVTLDLNGHTVKSSAGKTSIFQINIGGCFTVTDKSSEKNGKIIQERGNTVIFVNGGSFTLEAGTIENTDETKATNYGIFAYANTNSRVIINGGTVEAHRCVYLPATTSLTMTGGALIGTKTGLEAIALLGGEATVSGGKVSGYIGIGVYDASELTVSGTAEISGTECAVIGNGSEGRGNTVITISGGTITGEGTAHAIYHPQSGEMTVSDGTITGATGIEMRAGSLEVTGGTITGTAEFEKTPDGSGSTVVGVGIAVSQHTTNLDISVNISGGTIKGTKYALYEVDLQDEKTENIGLGITGGAFSVDKAIEGATAVVSENVTKFIGVAENGTSPTFNTAVDTALIEQGSGLTDLGDSFGVHVHVWSNTWVTNGTHHWHECTAENCNFVEDSDKDGYGVHDPDADDGDCTTEILCSKCDYVITNGNAGHTYTYSANGAVITETCANDGCTVHTATATIAEPTGTLTYSGENNDATVSYSTDWKGGTLQISYTKDTATASDTKGAGNYVASIAKNGETATVMFTIEKKDISDAKITLGDPLTYNGSEQEQSVASVIIGDLTVTYEVTGNRASNVKADGSYELTVTGTGNFTGTAKAEWNIAKATYDMSGVRFEDVNYTYDGTEKKVEIIGTLPEGVEVSYENNTLTNADSVEATAIFTGDSVNYNAIQSKTAMLTVLKADFSVEASGYDGVYDGQPHTVTVTADGATITYSTDGGVTYNAEKPTFTNAGEYKVYYKAVKANYNDVESFVTVRIAKATPILKITSDSVRLRGGGKITLTVTGAPAEGTYTITSDPRINKGTDGKYNLPNKTETYTFTVTYAESTNYNAATASCKVTTSLFVIVTRPSYCTVEFEENGGSTVKSFTKAYNSVIDLTDYVTERDGYEFTGWYLDKALTEEVTSIKLRKNTTVYAGWKKLEETPVIPDAVDNPFIDVPENEWYFDDVMYVYENKLMNGTEDNLFEPETGTSRGMIVTILWRLAGKPVAEYDGELIDVPSTMYYAPAVDWAAANGVLTGYGDGKFGPEDPITREQMVTILWRYAKLVGVDVTSGDNTDLTAFADYDQISDYAVPAMKWAVAEGIIGGSDGKRLEPAGNAERGAVAAILHRYCLMIEG